jgi:hypothetical protein
MGGALSESFTLGLAMAVPGYGFFAPAFFHAAIAGPRPADCVPVSNPRKMRSFAGVVQW